MCVCVWTQLATIVKPQMYDHTLCEKYEATWVCVCVWTQLTTIEEYKLKYMFLCTLRST